MKGNIYNGLVSDDFVNFKFRVIKRGNQAIVIGKHLEETIIISESCSQNYYENEQLAILGCMIRCAQKSKIHILGKQKYYEIAN